MPCEVASTVQSHNREWKGWLADDCGFRQNDSNQCRKRNLWSHFLRRHTPDSKTALSLRLLWESRSATRIREPMNCDECGYSTRYRTHLGPHHFSQHAPNSDTANEIRIHALKLSQEHDENEAIHLRPLPKLSSRDSNRLPSTLPSQASARAPFAKYVH